MKMKKDCSRTTQISGLWIYKTVQKILANMYNVHQRKINAKAKLGLICRLYTVVGDYINTMKATFDLNFDLYQAF